MWPASARPCRKAATTAADSLGDLLLRKPMTGNADCCARARTGNAPAPPRKPRNARRVILGPHLADAPLGSRPRKQAYLGRRELCPSVPSLSSLKPRARSLARFYGSPYHQAIPPGERVGGRPITSPS